MSKSEAASIVLIVYIALAPPLLYVILYFIGRLFGSDTKIVDSFEGAWKQGFWVMVVVDVIVITAFNVLF